LFVGCAFGWHTPKFANMLHQQTAVGQILSFAAHMVLDNSRVVEPTVRCKVRCHVGPEGVWFDLQGMGIHAHLENFVANVSLIDFDVFELFLCS
jgi:hypothetical protein